MFDPFSYVRKRLTEAIVGSVRDARDELEQTAQQQTPHLLETTARRIEPRNGKSRKATAR